jgi:hypothetical protein
MIASPVPSPRWLFALLVSAVVMTAWRAWPVAEEAPAAARPDVGPATYRYVPLLGLLLDDEVDAADGDFDAPPLEAPAGPVRTCLPFLAPILAHPRWQLRITTHHADCFAQIEGDFTIASTGDVTWTKPGWPVRHLALSGEQLALVQRLDQLSCVELQRQRSELAWLTIGLDLGAADDDAGARIQVASTLGRAVTAMLDELTEQYRGPQREAISAMDLQLATTAPGAIYRVRLHGGRLTVKHGRKLLLDKPVEPDLLVDLVDAALERPPADPDPDVKGVLRLHGRSVPVALAARGQSPFALIHWAIRDAQDVEA